MKLKLPTFFAKNLEAGILMEMFLVSAIASLLMIRAFLNISDYPQIGNSEFHIAHMLWGGVLMVLSIFILLSFLNKEAKRIAAIIGGIGFGAFIDELGKFITSDNDYFYRPTIAFIYIIFISLYLLIRILKRRANISPVEYAINALEVTKEIFLLDLDVLERKKAVAYLKKSDLTNPAVVSLMNMLKSFKNIKKQRDTLPSVIKKSLLKGYTSLVEQPWFPPIIVVIFVFFASYRFFRAIFFPFLRGTYFSWGQLISSSIMLSLTLLGVYYLRKRRRIKAYYAFKNSVLVSIFLVQFFLFLDSQLAAFWAFVVSGALYSFIQYLIDQERNLRKSR